ncbi:hypothetical protein GGI43DRAFT_426073 [Trichoderma evansii]
MATPPASRDEFEVALVCSLPLEYDAVSLLFDQFWDENGNQYGRAIGDPNTYTTGRFGNFDVVLVLLPNTGNISAASATASLRSSYPELRLVILTGICAGVPSSNTGDEVLLGDVIISKAVIQYDYGGQYPDDFAVKDTTEDSLGRPDKNIRSLVAVLETARERERVKKRAAVFLEHIQDLPPGGIHRKGNTYQYPGAASDVLFEAYYRHKHHTSPQCLCAQCHEYSDPVCDESRDLVCDVLGCNEKHVIPRQRLDIKRELEHQERNKEAQMPSVFIGRFGSSEKILKSGEHCDWIAKRYGDKLPCIIIKSIFNYADSHKNNRWQNFAAATAASVAKSLVERYTKTDKSAMIQIKQQLEQMMENKASNECLKDLHQTDPRDDKTRIQRIKGNLLKDSYRWVLNHDDFKQWYDNPQYRLLWIKGDPGKGKTMLLCGIIDEIEKSTTAHCLSYFFCQATEARLSSATAVLRGLIYMIIIQRPLLITHVRERYDSSGKKLFEDNNAWEALSKILMAILNDSSLDDAILMIDALDECPEGLPLLLEFLSEASSSSRVKWIVSSRNWPIIDENLDTAMQGVRLCLELNESSVSTAVQAYIQHKQHLMSNAHGTFLWVALVCQELGDPKIKKRHTLDKLKTSYPSGLDALYQRIMENIHDSLDSEACRQILAIISVVYRPITLAELSRLIDSYDYKNDDLIDIIGSCGSLLIIRDDIIYFVHQPAKDFLLDKASSQILVSGIEYQHYIIFSRSLKVLSKTIKRDVYNLQFPGFPIEQVSVPTPDPLAPITYSCIYWADHFCDTKRPQDENDITKFFELKFLYWLEALSLLPRVSKGIIAIQKLMERVQTPHLTELFEDANRLIIFHKRAIESAPLQVYEAALVFKEPKWLLTKPLMEARWLASLNILEGHTDLVTSIAFSHNSSLIASSSDDNTIRLWRTSTGDCMLELKGHSDRIRSVAFSYDSTLLASCSNDGIIWLWSVSTGESSAPMHNTIRLWHIDTGNSIHDFSHDSSLLASASGEGIIRIWSIDTSFDWPAIFSYDLTLLASVQDNCSIELWRIDTGECVHELEYSTDIRPDTGEYVRELEINDAPVEFAAFSYDLNLIAVPWMWKTIQQETFKLAVTSIVFSHDATLVASAASGKCLRELQGHRHGIKSIAFSHDSSLLASASKSGTIRIRCTNTGDFVREIWVSSSAVNVVAFSHDSVFIASGSTSASEDGTVRILCVATGAHVQTLRGHESPATSVAFSQVSAFVASATEDGTVQLWRVDTGDFVQNVFFDAISTNLSITSDNSQVLTNFGYIAIDSTASSDVEIPAVFSGIGVRYYYSWITWNNKNILKLPNDFGACHAAISGSTVAIGCKSGRVIIIRLSTEELLKIYDDADNNRLT